MAKRRKPSDKADVRVPVTIKRADALAIAKQARLCGRADVAEIFEDAAADVLDGMSVTVSLRQAMCVWLASICVGPGLGCGAAFARAASEAEFRRD